MKNNTVNKIKDNWVLIILGPISSAITIYLFLEELGVYAIIVLIVSIIFGLIYYTFNTINKLRNKISFLEKKVCVFSGSNEKKCPFGITEIIYDSTESIKNIIDVKSEYYFLGESGNIYLKYIEDNTSYKENFIKSSIIENKKYHFIIRNYKNRNLIEQQQCIRYDTDKDKVNSVRKHIEDSYDVQSKLRANGVDITTFLSDELCKFRIVIIDDIAYVSFYPKNEDIMNKPLIKIKESNDELNLYKWFKEYVKLSEKDIERRDHHRLIPSYLMVEKIEKNSNINIPECKFCKIAKKQSKEEYDTILFETDNFVVFPAKGHFIEGYLLLIPKAHYTSFSEITDKTLIREYKSLINRISQKMKNIFKTNITIFEHGSLAGGCIAGNTIEHAHLHIIPKKINIFTRLLKDGHIIKGVDSFEEIHDFNSPYLFIDNNEFKIASPVRSSYESQYLRRIAYNILYPRKNDNGWDWKKSEHCEKLKNTLKIFQ